MGLKAQLDQDLKTALRAKDETRVGTIRMLKAAISNFELAHGDAKNKDSAKPITEPDLLSVVEKQIKQRRESIELYRQGNRPDLADREAAEVAVLEAYLPRQLSREEIRAEVETIIAEIGTREFPQVMRQAATRLKGRADGKVVNEIVRELTA